MMRYTRFFAAVGLAGTLIAPSVATAQSRGRERARDREHARDGGHARDGERAVPRGSVRSPERRNDRGRPPAVQEPFYYRPYPYRLRDRAYRPGANFSFFYGYPGYFGSYAYGRPNRYRSYVYAAPYGYGYEGYSHRPYGGLRLDLPQRDAEVYVDGYFVGIVDDFDGRLQQANLEVGPHQIEVNAPGYQTLVFDVYVDAGRTITYRGSLRPAYR